MKIKLKIFAPFTFFVLIIAVNANTTERPRPAEWSNLVYGGRFMDSFLPMPNVGQIISDTWGDDNVHYNLIVNDWLGRIAVYERSKDGVDWKVESGEAYLPGVSVQQDGRIEGWWKYERLKIFQDKYGLFYRFITEISSKII